MRDQDRLNQRRVRGPQKGQRLSRSKDKVVAGVAGGLAEFVGANPFTVRVLLAITIALTAGVFLIAYGLLWLLVPQAKS